MREIKFNPKEQPKWWQFRNRLAYALVRVANWVKPNNPAVCAFYAQALHDIFIYGKHIVRVNPENTISEGE